MVSDACNPRILPAWTQSFICGGLHGICFITEFIVILYVSNIPYLMWIYLISKHELWIRRNYNRPRHQKTFWIPYRQIEFVFVWSTSNRHHLNPHVSAVVNCKLLIWIIMDPKSRCLWLFIILISNEHYLLTTNSNFPVEEFSCVCSNKAWCPLARMDSIILPYAKIPTFLWNGNYLIFPGISIFGIDSPLPNARDLRNL